MPKIKKVDERLQRRHESIGVPQPLRWRWARVTYGLYLHDEYGPLGASLNVPKIAKP